MAGTVFGVFCAISFLCAVYTENLAAYGNALFSGASDAVTLMLTLGGAMCLWCGVLEVFREAGAMKLVEGLLSPLLGWLFPAAKRANGGEGAAMEEIAASFAANLLGIGNAATPLGLAAMQALEDAAVKEDANTGQGHIIQETPLQETVQHNGTKNIPTQGHAVRKTEKTTERSSGLWSDMTMFTVLNTTPIALLPTTLLSLRFAAGSANPGQILPAVWMVSTAGFFFAAIITRALCTAKPSCCGKKKDGVDQNTRRTRKRAEASAAAEKSTVLGGIQ